MAEKRRPCSTCGKNRALRFFTSPRARQCVTCARSKRSTATRAVRLWETYGITEAEYNWILEAQHGVCGICRGKRSYNLDVDHDHAKERTHGTRASVRGLLCKTCNRRLLKAAKDSSDILGLAIDYLAFPPARAVIAPGLARPLRYRDDDSMTAR